MTRVAALPVAIFTIFSIACGGGSNTPTAPSPPPIAAVAGGWTGTLESSNFNTQAVTVDLQQTSATVSGTWVSGGPGWRGNINGTVDASSFTGTVTLTAPTTGGGLCNATATFSGNAGATTMRWTSVGFAQATCNGVPTGLTMALQRR